MELFEEIRRGYAAGETIKVGQIRGANSCAAHAPSHIYRYALNELLQLRVGQTTADVATCVAGAPQKRTPYTVPSLVR